MKGADMKIPIKDTSTENGSVFVRGVWGPRTIKLLLEGINSSIQKTNEELRKLNGVTL